MVQTVSGKVDETYGPICLVSMFSSLIIVFKLSNKVHFLQFCGDLSKKLKSVKAIRYMDLKVLITLFEKVIWVIGL